VDRMAEIRHAEPLSMSFCLDCHRNPASNLRPTDQVFSMDWNEEPRDRTAQGERYVHDWRVMSLQNCSACHR
jgi:hypothetical protein